jgi:prepilin-type processing-associated H-X9-DG protein
MRDAASGVRRANWARAGGFTVIELLAVTLVVGLLGIFFLPLWASTRAQARNRLCSENLQQIGRAVGIYVGDNAGKFPGCQHEQPSWTESLAAYCPPERFVCAEEVPAADRKTKEKKSRWTYALNDFLTPHPYGARQLDFSRIESVMSPGETMMFAEAAIEYRAYDHFHFADAIDNGFTPEAFGEQVDVERHESAANYLFSDGHVEELGWSSGARPKLNFPKSRFVHPGGEAGAQQMARR